MAKAFYSEYVKHCLRFYARHADPVFRNDIDRYNWNACESALRLYSGKEECSWKCIEAQTLYPITSTGFRRWRMCLRTLYGN